MVRIPPTTQEMHLDVGLTPGGGGSPGGGHGNPLQCSCLENPMAGYSPWGHKQLDMTETTEQAHTINHNRSHIRSSTRPSFRKEWFLFFPLSDTKESPGDGVPHTVCYAGYSRRKPCRHTPSTRTPPGRPLQAWLPRAGPKSYWPAGS